MSLYLPPELRWLGWIAGGTWPDGDEDKIWNVSEAYRDAAEALRKLIPEIEDVKRTAVSAYPEGDGGDKIGAMFDEMLTGDQSMESLAHFMDQISDATNDFGVSIQTAKLMTIVSLIALAIEIAWAWAFPPTALAVEAAEEAATQIVMRRLETQLQERILAKVLSVFGSKFANLSKGWMLKIVEAALVSGTLDAAVQGGQILFGHHRKNFDWKEFGGALAAGFGAPFGRAAANSINKFTTKFLGDKLSNPWVRAGNGVIVGIGSSPVFNGIGGVGSALITGDWAGTLGNPAGWVGGAAHGGIVGGVRGYFGHNRFDSKSFEVDWKIPGDGAANVPVRGGYAFDAGGLGPHGFRGGVDGDHSTAENPPVGSYGPRGSNGGGTVDNSSPVDGKSGLQGNEQIPPRSTVPAAASGTDSVSESPSRSPEEVSHRTTGSNEDSSANNSNTNYTGTNSSETNNSGANKQSRPVAADNDNAGQSSSSSGPHETPAADESKAGGANGNSSASNGSSASGGSRNESPASSNSAGSSAGSSNSNGTPPSRASSSANPSGDGRNSSAIGGSSDRPTGGAGDSRGGSSATRPASGSDGSAQLDRPPTSQVPRGGIGQTSSRSPDSNFTAGQSQRGPASVSEVSSAASGQSPRSSAVSEVSSTGSGQPPRRPLDANPGGAQQRPAVSDPGPDSAKPRASVSNSGSGEQSSPTRRTPAPESDSGSSSPSRQRPPESNASGIPPQRQRPPAGDQPPQASVPQEQHSDPGGQRGHDDVESIGGTTFEGDREHPNWARSEGGDVVITSPDGTEHRVDKQQNIFIGRPGDETWVMIRPDRSVEFVPSNGGAPVAPSGPRAGTPGGPGPSEEFGFGRNDGTQYKVLSDNSVQTTSPDNWTTIIKRNGGADLRAPWDERTQFEPDGTTIHTRPGDPAIVTTPDGTVHVVPNDKAGRKRDEDGNLVVTSPDGTEHVIGDDGTIVVGRPGDPQRMKVDSDRPIVFVGPDGTSSSADPGATAGKGSGVQSPTFTRPDRVSHTVLDDGSVRTKSPDEWTTTVRPNGAAEFTSPTGDKTVHKADGTVVESGPGKPTVTTGPDGTKQTAEPNGAVTVEDPDGTKHVVFDSTDAQGGGRTRHPDQTVIHFDLKDTLNLGPRDRLGGFGQDGPRKPGVIQMDRPDGIGFESSPEGIKVFAADGTTYERDSDGSVRITAPNGHTESRPMTEPIELAEGTELEKTPEGFRVVHEDGSVSEIGPRGASFTDSEKVVRGTRTDGTAFVERPDETVRDKTVREVRGDGAVRVTESDQTAWGSRGDGTTWKVDDENKVHVSGPDGTVAPPADPKSPYVEGSRQTAMIKPRYRNSNDPLPGGYEAPIAPDTEDWIPPGYETDDVPPELFQQDPPNQDDGGSSDQNQWDTPGQDYWGPPDSGSDSQDSWNPDLYNDTQDYQGPGGDDVSHNTGGSGQGGNSSSSGRGGNSGGAGHGSDSGGAGGGNSGGANHGGNSGGSGSGNPGGSDHGGNSGGSSRGGNSGGSDHAGSSAGSGHDGGNSGGSGDRGGHGSSGNDRQPPPEHRQSPPPPRLDPAALSRMLQSLHAADGMAPPSDEGGSSSSPNGAEGGQGTNGQGALSPDSWRLGPGNGLSSSSPATGGSSGSAVPNGVSSTSQRSAADSVSGPARPDLSALRGALDRVGEQGAGGPGQEASDQPGALNNAGTTDSLKSTQDPASQDGRGSTQDHPGTPGHEGDSGRPGASQNSDDQQRSGQQGDANATGGENNSGSLEPGTQPGTDAHAGTSGPGSQSGASDSQSPSDGTGAGDHSGTAGSGDQGVAPGTGIHPGTGGHPGATAHPGATQHPDHPRITGQQGDSGSNEDGTNPSMPGRMPASPMQDEHQPPGLSSPGGAPSSSGAPPSADVAGAKKKQSRRPRKKSDKPRKKPKVVLTFSPFETPEHRAGVDDSTDVPFTLGAPASATEPVIEKRPATKALVAPPPLEEPEQRVGADGSTDITVTVALGDSTSATEPVIEKRPTTKTMRSTTDG